LPFFTCLFNQLHKCCTVMGWIECLKPNCRGNRACVEIYILSWLAIILSIFFLNLLPVPECVKCIFLLLVFLRLFDIVLTAVHLTFFRYETPTFPARSLILLFINYIEIILIFSTVNFICGSNFSTIYSSFHFSVDVFVPLISIDSHRLPIPYYLFLIQIGVSFIIHITIIQRVLSYFAVQRLN